MKKTFRIMWLGNKYNIKIDEKDIITFKDMFRISYGLFDFLRQLDFMEVKYKVKEVK